MTAPATPLGGLEPMEPRPDMHAIDVLLIGALLCRADAGVLDLVRDDDVQGPLSVVLATLRSLHAAGRPTAPQLVLDNLVREGRVHRGVLLALMNATTSGAEPLAVRDYAAATVAASLRRRVNSAGHALLSAACDIAEVDLAPMASRCVESITDCARRLAVLRGEPDEFLR